jgi:hypothetical protein
MTRNVFFDLCHDEAPLPIAPVKHIAITDELRAADVAAQAARKPVITWTPRLSDPKQAKPKAHKPAKETRVRSVPAKVRARELRQVRQEKEKREQNRNRPCTKCGEVKVSRKNKVGLCAACNPRFSVLPREQRVAAGLCFRCSKPLDTELTRCSKCKVIHASNSARRYARNKDVVLRYRAAQAETRRKRAADGLCCDCGAPGEGFRRCERCRDLEMTRRAKRKGAIA